MAKITKKDLSLAEWLTYRHGIYPRSFLKFSTFASSLTDKRYKIMVDDIKNWGLQVKRC